MILIVKNKMKFLNQFEQLHNPAIDEKFHQLHIGNIGNVIYWQSFFEMLRGVEGDIVECGVGRGRSLMVISALNHFLDESEGGQRHIYGYDSFEGFPKPTKEDASPRNVQKGEWSYSPSGKYKYSPEFLKEVLKEGGVPTDEQTLTLTKGFFGDSLPHHPQRPIAMLHIEGNLYQSNKDILENLFDRLSQGGVIVFNDFTCNKDDEVHHLFPGGRQAVKEYLKEEYHALQPSVRASYYYVKKTPALLQKKTA